MYRNIINSIAVRASYWYIHNCIGLNFYPLTAKDHPCWQLLGDNRTISQCQYSVCWCCRIGFDSGWNNRFCGREGLEREEFRRKCQCFLLVGWVDHRVDRHSNNCGKAHQRCKERKKDKWLSF